jgi:hypothetical protein
MWFKKVINLNERYLEIEWDRPEDNAIENRLITIENK